MSLANSRGRSGQKCRYNVSASLQQGRKSNDRKLRRLSAATVERIAIESVARWLPQERSSLDHLAALRLRADGLLFELARIRPGRHATQFPDGQPGHLLPRMRAEYL